MNAEQNELITRIGPGTPCGTLMRHYWQPVALMDEFDPQLDAAMALLNGEEFKSLPPSQIVPRLATILVT